jgi:hypothetical protein
LYALRSDFATVNDEKNMPEHVAQEATTLLNLPKLQLHPKQGRDFLELISLQNRTNGDQLEERG